MRPAFQERFREGKIGEIRIRDWLRRHWRAVVPIQDDGKVPLVFVGDEQLTAPDIMVVSWAGSVAFIEAKRKRFTNWYYTKGEWQTGMDWKRYQDYLKVSEKTGIDVWFLFLHENPNASAADIAHGAPEHCPVGLYGCLSTFPPDHKGLDGIAYWNLKDLRRFYDFVVEVP